MRSSALNSCDSGVFGAGDVGALLLQVDGGAAEMENHRRLTRLGTRSTLVTNWRIVRPREMRAMNMPTKGVQEIHHAQ